MYNKLLGSSVNPEKLGLTIKGIIVGIIPIILIFSGGKLNESDLINFVEAVGGAVAAGMVLYGLGRKIWVKFTTPKPE